MMIDDHVFQSALKEMAAVGRFDCSRRVERVTMYQIHRETEASSGLAQQAEYPVFEGLFDGRLLSDR